MESTRDLAKNLEELKETEDIQEVSAFDDALQNLRNDYLLDNNTDSRGSSMENNVSDLGDIKDIEEIIKNHEIVGNAVEAAIENLSGETLSDLARAKFEDGRVRENLEALFNEQFPEETQENEGLRLLYHMWGSPDRPHDSESLFRILRRLLESRAVVDNAVLQDFLYRETGIRYEVGDIDRFVDKLKERLWKKSSDEIKDYLLNFLYFFLLGMFLYVSLRNFIHYIRTEQNITMDLYSYAESDSNRMNPFNSPEMLARMRSLPPIPRFFMNFSRISYNNMFYARSGFSFLLAGPSTTPEGMIRFIRFIAQNSRRLRY